MDRLQSESFLAIATRNFHCEPAEAWIDWPALEADEEADEEAPIRYLVMPESLNAAGRWIQVEFPERLARMDNQRLVRLRDVTAVMATQRDMWSFHSMVMHKLNTPLNVALGSLELLEPELFETMDAAEIGEFVAMAQGGIKRLASVIHDIQRFSTSKSMIDTITSCTVAELERIVESVANDIGVVDLDMSRRCSVDLHVGISQQVLETILIELFENARKFHPDAQPSVAVSLSIEEAKEVAAYSKQEYLCVRIADNGISLTPQQIRRVWHPYYQAEKHFTGEIPGLGLGLPMIASLVWEVGGHCRVRNVEEAAGVMVELFLPYFASAEEMVLEQFQTERAHRIV